MTSIIMCEGLTDCLFVQYYMRKVYSWQDERADTSIRFMNWNRVLKKGTNKIIVGHRGGSSSLIYMLDKAFKRNSNALPKDVYNNIVLMTDRDDADSELNIISLVKETIEKYGGEIKKDIKNNEWITVSFPNSIDEEITISLLLLVIPLDEYGAIETVLLNSIADKDEYDRILVDSCRDFVDNADLDERYLKRRRHKLKAWFNVFFSIRVPEDFYIERQKIFMEFPWENHPRLRLIFSKLDYLNE
ncbi:MAG: hypothetical protein LUG60_06805 [Erysipelotrichaceae bacterium]|nr:hypothetical protein [Erysipelotrichaceae bacterium]